MSIFLVRMCRYFSTSDTIDILRLVGIISSKPIFKYLQKKKKKPSTHVYGLYVLFFSCRNLNKLSKKNSIQSQEIPTHSDKKYAHVTPIAYCNMQLVM